MTFLLFQLGRDRYVLEAGRVMEVVPLVELKQIPEALPGVAGMFNYHGKPVPVVDLSQLTTGHPANERLSTRIIIVNYPDETGREHPLGLIAEHATGVIRRETADFVEPGIKLGGGAYLGPVLTDSEGVIQWVHAQRLLPAPVRDRLFGETAEVGR
jgi:chemotaxis-related protein WspB